eukprot:gene4646-4898_t
MVALTARALTLASKEGVSDPATLQVKKALTDGSLTLHDNDVVSVTDYVCNLAGEEHILIVTSLQVLQSRGNTSVDASKDAAGAKPDQMASAASEQAPLTPQTINRQAASGGCQAPHATPVAAPNLKQTPLTPGPTPSPSEEVKTSGEFATPRAAASRLGMGSTPQPPMSVVARKAGVTPIAALNPYDTRWVIKAKVAHKAPPRTFNGRGGSQQRVFSAELADALGGHIQATFWREAAEKYVDALQEGKVYYFSNFTVRPANKHYATVKNDYEISFDGRTEVEEAADQTGISLTHQLDLVPFDKLTRFINKKMTVDVLGVVTHCSSLGTVKRKADQSEVPRRDVTLVDKTARSVVLTLWADHATSANLEGCEGQLMQVTCVRVGEYNGCSLSAVTRSQVTLNPEGEVADALRCWWEDEGSSASITPLGQATAGGAAGGAAAGRSNKLQFLSDVVGDADLSSTDSKPTYHDALVYVTQVKEDQTMYYLANPDGGKKVEERDGRYWCEGEGRFVDAAERRYVLSVRVADASQEVWVNMFNDQGQQLLGQSADELAGVRESEGEEAFSRVVKRCKFSEWAMTLAARVREYNGERRMRYTMSAVNYIQEGQRLLQLIQHLQ